MTLTWDSISWLILFIVFLIGLILRAVGLFDIFSWITKILDLRDREKSIINIEKINKVMEENLRNISDYIEIHAILISTALDFTTPFIDMKFRIYNRSIYDINLTRLSYTPSLIGVPGVILEEKDRNINLIIGPQSQVEKDERLIITLEICDELLKLKDKSIQNGTYSDIRWNLRLKIRIDEPEVMELPIHSELEIPIRYLEGSRS